MTILEQKIIEFLGRFPEREFYGQEIADKVKCSKASASIILKSLVKNEMVFLKEKGHMKFYQINPRNPELKKIKINSAINTLKPLVRKFKNQVLKIILFGSASRGEQTFNSDLDVFVLVNNKNEARDALKKSNIDSRIKAVVKTPSEWSEMEITEPEFYQEVKNGIIIYEYVPRI